MAERDIVQHLLKTNQLEDGIEVIGSATLWEYSEMQPVTLERINIATDYGLHNSKNLADACVNANVPFYVGCAFYEQESGGRNCYGHDAGGALSGYPRGVNKSNWLVFWWLVDTCGQTSNGVGPLQITYKGFFKDMLNKNLRPWDAYDSTLYGLQLIRKYYDSSNQSSISDKWQSAATSYNGGTVYGQEVIDKIHAWKTRLGIK